MSPEPPEQAYHHQPTTSRDLTPPPNFSPTTSEDVEIFSDIEIEHIDIDDIKLDALE